MRKHPQIALPTSVFIVYIFFEGDVVWKITCLHTGRIHL